MLCDLIERSLLLMGFSNFFPFLYLRIGLQARSLLIKTHFFQADFKRVIVRFVRDQDQSESVRENRNFSSRKRVGNISGNGRKCSFEFNLETLEANLLLDAEQREFLREIAERTDSRSGVRGDRVVSE